MHSTDQQTLVKQKPSKYGQSRKEQFKAFIDGFISGSAGGAAASLDVTDRVVLCSQCGHKEIENFGDEFQ